MDQVFEERPHPTSYPEERHAVNPGDEGTPPAPFLTHNLHGEQRQGDEAIARYRDLLDRFPTHLDGLRGMALAFEGAGRYEDALNTYQTLSQLHPEHLFGWLGVARLLQRQRRWREALEAYENVQTRFPDDLEASIGKADVLAESGQLKRAQSIHHQLCRISPIRGQAVLGLAFTSREAGEREAISGVCREWAGLDASTRTHPATKGTTLVTGHSHIAAIKEALSLPNRAASNFVAHFLPVQALISSSGSIEDLWHKALVLCDSATRVFVSMGGNEHSILGLARHPVPYAFSEMATIAQAESIAGAHYISSGLMREILRGRMASTIKLIWFFAALFKEKLYLLESPPPSPSEEHLRSVLDKNEQLIANVRRYGISPAPLRLALWRMRSEIIKNLSQIIGCVYLRCPGESQDSAGYLIESVWSNATHANELYGAMVLEQIAALVRE